MNTASEKPLGTDVLAAKEPGDESAIDRVLVLEDRRLVEDGRPTELAERPDSAYRRLLLAERDVRAELWADPTWRRLRVEAGRITEAPRGEAWVR